MKHDGWTTLKLVLWFLASVFLGLVAIVYVHSKTFTPEMPLWTAVISVVIGLALGIVFWYFVFRYIKTNLIVPFAISVAYSYAKLAELLFGKDWFVMGMAALLGVTSYICAVWLMRVSWDWTKRLLWYSNVVMVMMMAWIGATLGAFTPPLAAIIILVLLAAYDAYAVWKSKHMQEWAKEFLKQRIIPGLAVAKEKKDEFALLGGGDVFFIIFVAGSFWKTSPWMSFVSLLAMTGSVVLLFIASKKGKFYPALPFILAAELGALLVGWLVL